MDTLDLVGIVGSLREKSTNGALARAAIDAAPGDVRLTLHDVADVPLFNGDVEDAGAPDSVASLVRAVDQADGLLFFSPEYNSSFPAVTKNVIDWLSRSDTAWEGTATTMLTISPGRRAGAGVRDHFSAIMSFQSTRLFETFGVGESPTKLGPDNSVTDAETLDRLAEFMRRFSAFARDAD